MKGMAVVAFAAQTRPFGKAGEGATAPDLAIGNDIGRATAAAITDIRLHNGPSTPAEHRTNIPRRDPVAGKFRSSVRRTI